MTKDNHTRLSLSTAPPAGSKSLLSPELELMAERIRQLEDQHPKFNAWSKIPFDELAESIRFKLHPEEFQSSYEEQTRKIRSYCFIGEQTREQTTPQRDEFISEDEMCAFLDEAREKKDFATCKDYYRCLSSLTLWLLDKKQVSQRVLKKLDQLTDKRQEEPEGDEELARRLMPFFTSEEEAKKFPDRIRGMKNTEITKLVNVLWEKGVISDETKPTDLWRVLHDLGFYTASDRNWNSQVMFVKRR